jgi:TRAP-type C4-dicarboxylate transport system permease small subunit
MKMIDRLMKRLLQAVQLLAGTAFTALFVVTLLRILLRNVIGISWFWIDGFSRLSFIWTVFLGASSLYATDDHLVMDFFVGKMNATARKRLALAINLVFLLFVLALIYYGFLVFKVRLRIPYTYWNVPTGYAYLAAPVCGILMLLFCLQKLAHHVRGRDGAGETEAAEGSAGKIPAGTP